MSRRGRTFLALLATPVLAFAEASASEPEVPAAHAAAPVVVETMPEQGVVVTGTRTPRKLRDDPIGTEVVGAKELGARNVRDASTALAAEPGIQVERSFRGSSFQLRGLDAKYVRMLMDGMPLVGQVNDTIDLRRYATEGIERIEVLRGTASALYGSDALAGVVNLISRRPRQPLEGSVFAQYSPDRAVPLVGKVESTAVGGTLGTRQGDLAASLSFNWFGNDSYTLSEGDPAALPTNGDSRSSGMATGRVFWTPSPQLEAMAFVRGGGFFSRGVDLQLPRALFNRRVGEQELSAGTQATWRPDEQTRLVFFLQGNGFWREFWREQRQVAGSAESMNSLETLVRGEVQADRAVSPTLEVLGGAGGQVGALSSPRLEQNGGSVASGWAFAQVEWRPHALVDLVAGGRLDVDQLFGVHATPRAVLRLKADPLVDGLSLRLKYGEGFRAPSFGERYLAFHNQVANYVVYGNKDLGPELSRGFEAGLDWTPAWPGAGVVPTARVNVFRSSLTGLIQPVERADSSLAFQRFQYLNYSEATIGGVEAATRISAGEWLVADLGYAWLDTRATIDGVTRVLPGRAARQVTGMVVLQSDEWGTQLTARGQLLFGRTALDADVMLDPVAIADLRLGQRVWRAEKGGSELQLYVTADNVLDVTDPNFFQYPGRVIQAGLQARH